MLRSVGDTRVDVALLGLTFLAYAWPTTVTRSPSSATPTTPRAWWRSPTSSPRSSWPSRPSAAPRSRPSRACSNDASPGPGRRCCRTSRPSSRSPSRWSGGWRTRVAGGLAAAVLVLTGVRQLFSTSRALPAGASSWSDASPSAPRRSRSITERHRELEAMKYAFLSAVSHELRTPLTAIRGSLELLEDGDGGELSSARAAGGGGRRPRDPAALAHRGRRDGPRALQDRHLRVSPRAGASSEP